MPSCVVCGRSRNSKSKSDVALHFTGPIQDDWITFAFECGIHASMLKPLHSLFCSEHFNKNCFEKYVRTTLLKLDSVPSIMVQRIKCAKVLYPEKAVPVAMDLNNSSTNDTQDDGIQKIDSMKMVISSLKKNNLLNDDELELFTEQFGKHNDLIKRFVKKGKGQKIHKKYSPEHHVKWNGNKYHRYVNFGAGFNNDKSDIATKCFKIPMGYFLCNHLNSSQKSELIQQCLNLTNKTGIKVVSLTFDGCASNINMSKLLGCDLDPTSFKINFEFKSIDSLTQNIAIFLDPAHMVKLVRNTLGEKKIIIDGENNIIKFDYLEKLLILQESEGLHLFIRIFNTVFDILNSRNLNDYGKKKALWSQSLEDFKIFKTQFYEYVLNLKFPCGTSVLSSNRKTRFLGFMIRFESLFFLHNELIATSCLKFIPYYKISQDHIELFFGAIRSHQGHNNPTAYLKLLIHAEIKQGGIGNCIPLEDVDILISSSSYFLKDHDYIFDNSLSMLTREIVIYLSDLKDNGGLTYLSADVINICIQTEKNIRSYEIDSLKKLTKLFIQNKTLQFFINDTTIFETIKFHNENDPLQNHVILLIKSVITSYYNIKIHHLFKKPNEKDSLRTWYNKIILFKGQ
ncbi:hypothetical protein QTP88_024036 [Uroleucon formosanum]